MTDKGLLRLREKVDAFMQRIQQAHGAQVACREACSDCCRVDLSVFPVEAGPIVEALKRMPRSLLAEVSRRAEEDRHCVFLVDDRCVVYDQRPIICRTQGLPLLLEDGAVAVCPHNFKEAGRLEVLPPEDVLNLKTVNALLSVVHRIHISSEKLADERIRLAVLPWSEV